MCDDNCDKFSPDRIRCEACRTINLARAKEQKPNMLIYDKCKIPPPCLPIAEMPITPTCIKVCNKEDYIKCTCPRPAITVHPHPGHGKLMYLVKAGLLVGITYFTYTQGIWGDQQDVTECMKRWQEYCRSFTSRRPPVFDKCGKVVSKPTSDTLMGPLYGVYKTLVTTVFSGIVKFPTIIKCIYMDYLRALQAKEMEEAKERRIRRKSM